MRLGTCLLYEGCTLQGAHAQLADFFPATVGGFYAAVDIVRIFDLFLFGLVIFEKSGLHILEPR